MAQAHTNTAAQQRHRPWWEGANDWQRRDDDTSREIARAAGLVWSTRTQQWMARADRDAEDRRAFAGYATARQQYHATCPVQWR